MPPSAQQVGLVHQPTEPVVTMVVPSLTCSSRQWSDDMDWEAGMAIFKAILPVTEFLLANGPAFGFTHKEWINLMQWIAGAPLDPEMDRLRESEGSLAERLRWITPPHEVPEKKWRPFIATAMSAAKRLVLRPAELKTTAVLMPLTSDSHGGTGRRDAIITMLQSSMERRHGLGSRDGHLQGHTPCDRIFAGQWASIWLHSRGMD